MPAIKWYIRNNTIKVPTIGSTGKITGWIYAKYNAKGICGKSVISKNVARSAAFSFKLPMKPNRSLAGSITHQIVITDMATRLL